MDVSVSSLNWMCKHKSEVSTVKIQLKLKFPYAVITKIRNLPPVNPKIFRTAVWWKIRDGYFWHYVCKTIYLFSRKVAVGKTLLKSLSAVDILLQILQEFRHLIKERCIQHLVKHVFFPKSYLLFIRCLSGF